MNTLLAVISGDDIVHSMMAVLVVGICVLIVWWMGRWFATKFGAPPIVLTVWNGLFILLGGIVLVNFLLGLVGHPLVKF